VTSESDSATRQERRLAQWRAARLAALVAVVGKMGHDVRGALSPGLLMAERLSTSTDPLVPRVAESVARSVDRATELIRQTVEFAREGPVRLPLEPVGLRTAVAEAVRAAGPQAAGLRLEMGIPEELQAQGHAPSIIQGLAELLGNAAAAGARVVTLVAERAGRAVALLIADDGPGLPAIIAEAPFRPFVGEGRGVGLAIARDLALAQGGDLQLLHTGLEGTSWRLTLPLALPLRQGIGG
jgi:signal transduction histidine kinase